MTSEEMGVLQREADGIRDTLVRDGTGDQQYGELHGAWKLAKLAANLLAEALYELRDAIEKQERA